MAVPVFVDKIFCGRLAERSKPLRAPRGHPEKISGGHWIQRITEAINAAAFEHDKSMLHHMHFDHAERSPGLIDHRIYGEVKAHLVGKKALHLQAGIVLKWMRSDRIFVRNDQMRRFGRGEGLIEFLNYC